MHLYHGTKEHHLESFRRGLQVGHPNGDFGPRFYLTPIIEVAVWFALYWGGGRPTQQPPTAAYTEGESYHRAALLLFELPLQDYLELSWRSCIEPPLCPDASGPAKPAPHWRTMSEHLAIGPITRDWQHLANGVQYAVSLDGLALFKPEIVGAAVEGAWTEPHVVFTRGFPYEKWGVETTVLRDPV
jgi:hypothetical protein